MPFQNCSIHIVSKGIGPKRFNLFKSQVEKYGGTVCSKPKCDSAHSHVICDEDLKSEDKEVQQFLSLGVNIIGTKWLSESFKMKELAVTDKFIVHFSNVTNQSQPPEIKEEGIESEPDKKKSKLEFDDMKRKEITSPEKSSNAELVDELSKLAKTYKSLGDVYRSRNYVSAVSIIQKYPKKISSYDEALTIDGITQNMATKIGEILETGSLRKAKELAGNDKLQVIELFSQIWGVGPATASSWFCQGYRTLDDIKKNCTLTKMQHVGLKYFNEFKTTIPRSEVEEISSKVEDAAKSIDANVKIEICGSYRRGKVLCGDVDVVIFEAKEEPSNLMEILLKVLTSSGFVSNEFTSLETARHHKFLGICKLPGENSVFRRLDIFIAPLKEYAPAMIHYTGSANFNVGLRQHAIKKGMHLSENGLYDKVIKQGSHMCAGTALHTPTEKSVFELLGVPYKGPEEREIFLMEENG